jgi:hypothetical protein
MRMRWRLKYVLPGELKTVKEPDDAHAPPGA